MIATDIFRMDCTVGGNPYMTIEQDVQNANPSPHATTKLYFLFLFTALPPPPTWAKEDWVICFPFTGICFLIYIIEFLAELWALKYDLSCTIHFYKDHKYETTFLKEDWYRGKDAKREP